MNNSTSNSVNELDSTNLLVTLYRWRLVIIILVAASIVIAAVASFFITPKYKSTVTLFPTKDNSMGEHLYESPGRILIENGDEEEGEYLMQLLSSNEVKNKIADRFDLWSVYKIEKGAPQSKGYLDLAYSENVSVEATKYGSILVSVLDEDPQRAADIANTIADLSDSLHLNMRKERAMIVIQSAEKNLEEIRKEIIAIKDSIKALGDEGVFSFAEQILGMSKSYGKALADGQTERAERIKKEMQAISKHGSDYLSLQTHLNLVSSREAHVIKRLGIFRTEYESILPAKMTVDKAEVPDKKAYPIRWLIVAMSALSTLIFAVAFILIWETFSRLKRQGLI